MYGEPHRIREIAQRLEQRAETLRARAAELESRSDGVAWVSTAADRMREAARERRDELLEVARDYDEAAQKVREHAAEVQRLLDLIASIERQARAIIEGALDRARAAFVAVVDGAGERVLADVLDDRLP